jgi:hypothetical protein
VLFLQAQKLGFTVLTANVSDFDVLLQLLPAGRALFYRRKAVRCFKVNSSTAWAYK